MCVRTRVSLSFFIESLKLSPSTNFQYLGAVLPGGGG